MIEKNNGEELFVFSEPTSGGDISIYSDSIGKILVVYSKKLQTYLNLLLKENEVYYINYKRSIETGKAVLGAHWTLKDENGQIITENPSCFHKIGDYLFVGFENRTIRKFEIKTGSPAKINYIDDYLITTPGVPKTFTDVGLPSSWNFFCIDTKDQYYYDTEWHYLYPASQVMSENENKIITLEPITNSCESYVNSLIYYRDFSKAVVRHTPDHHFPIFFDIPSSVEIFKEIRGSNGFFLKYDGENKIHFFTYSSYQNLEDFTLDEDPSNNSRDFYLNAGFKSYQLSIYVNSDSATFSINGQIFTEPKGGYYQYSELMRYSGANNVTCYSGNFRVRVFAFNYEESGNFTVPFSFDNFTVSYKCNLEE